jgi:hypothetical protein
MLSAAVSTAHPRGSIHSILHFTLLYVNELFHVVSKTSGCAHDLALGGTYLGAVFLLLCVVQSARYGPRASCRRANVDLLDIYVSCMHRGCLCAAGAAAVPLPRGDRTQPARCCLHEYCLSIAACSTVNMSRSSHGISTSFCLQNVVSRDGPARTCRPLSAQVRHVREWP